MHLPRVVRFAFCLLMPILAQTLSAQDSPDWSEPMAPYRVIGNVYYVGSKGLAIYLVTTPAGHVLLNAGLETSAPLIKTNIETLGFKISDVKILLISHAHWDHCAGSAAILKLSGAKYMVMDGDVPVVEDGGKSDFHYGDAPGSQFAPAKVDRVLHDGDEVKLGGETLVAHKTPGHTKGCTTWTWQVSDAGKLYNVVVVGSPNVNAGYKLVNNSKYPQIADDYQTTFRVLKSLPCDVFLGAHGDYYGMLSKLARVKEGGTNVFIDPQGYQRYVAKTEQAFLTALKNQQR